VLDLSAVTSNAVSLAVGAGFTVDQPSNNWRCTSKPTAGVATLQVVLVVLVVPPPALFIAEVARSAVRGAVIAFLLLRLLRFPDFVFVAVAPGLNSLGGNHVIAIDEELNGEAIGI
jgi:hypothetical protein